MPGKGSNTPSAGSRSNLKLSSGNVGAKSDVNPVSAKGEITSPKDAYYPKSSQSASQNSAGLPKPNITQHPLYDAVQNLNSDLQTFLQHDWETNTEYKHTRLKYYRILHHFDPETESLPSHRKDVLVKEFKKLLPKLSAFCLPPPPPPDEMDTDDPTLDYDPLNRRTTIAMLKSVIESKKPQVHISSVALKDDILALYKHYVNRDLELPNKDKFTKRPRVVHPRMVSKLSIHELRHAIQAHHPEVFLNVPVLRLAHYVSLYHMFVIEEPLGGDAEDLVPGYHYWIIKDLVKSKK